MEHKLDNIDRKIIKMLQKNARIPVKDIAKEVFLSSPAVSARIEHLEKSGTITGDYAMLIEVGFRSTVELDYFINELQQFGRTKTLIVHQRGTPGSACGITGSFSHQLFNLFPQFPGVFLRILSFHDGRYHCHSAHTGTLQHIHISGI